jgi:hypothetical protein
MTALVLLASFIALLVLRSGLRSLTRSRISDVGKDRR